MILTKKTDPASTYPKPIYHRQTASTETAYPATASLVTTQSTHNKVLHTLFDLNHTLPLSAASRPHQQQIPAIESSLPPYAGTTHQIPRRRKKNNPAISPLDPASSSPSPTWKEMTKGGARSKTLHHHQFRNQRRNAFPLHTETIKIASSVSSLLLSHQFLPYHIT